MLRVILFLVTNLAVLVTVGIVFNLLGLEQLLYRQGIRINLEGMLFFCALMGMTGSLISLLMSKPVAKWTMGVYVIDRPRNETEAWLLETVARLARKAGIGMPEVGIFASPEPNAFATGWNKNNALVAVSTGLFEVMDSSEIEAVLGHEISHIKNGDMTTLALIQGVLNTFVYFFSFIVSMLIAQLLFSRNQEEEGAGMGFAQSFVYYTIQSVLQLLFGILATIVVMAFSRWREYRADAGGARLTTREQMVSALEALRRCFEAGEIRGLPASMRAFGIVGFLSLADLFRSHPPLEKRIERLLRARL